MLKLLILVKSISIILGFKFIIFKENIMKIINQKYKFIAFLFLCSSLVCISNCSHQINIADNNQRTIKMGNGNNYEGDILNGKPHGKGKWTFPDGIIYEGNFQDGLCQGEGKMTYPNGIEFVGNFNKCEKVNGKFIIPEKCDINSSLNPKDGLTPLLIAVSIDNIDLVKELVNKGADIDLPNNVDNFTPLLRAIVLDHTKIARYLIDNGANIEARTNYQETALIVAARKNNAEIVELIVNKGANVNTKRYDGETALSLATQNNSIKIVHLLVLHGADPKIKNNKGVCAVEIARDNKNFKIINIILTEMMPLWPLPKNEKEEKVVPMEEAIKKRAADYVKRGKLRQSSDLINLALNDYNEAIKLNSSNEKVYFRRAEIWNIKKQSSKAIEDLNKSIIINPKYLKAYLLLGDISFKTKDYKNAVENYDHALNLDNKIVYVYARRGFSYLMISEKEKGCQDLNQACDLGHCETLSIVQNKLKLCNDEKQ